MNICPYPLNKYQVWFIIYGIEYSYIVIAITQMGAINKTIKVFKDLTEVIGIEEIDSRINNRKE